MKRILFIYIALFSAVLASAQTVRESVKLRVNSETGVYAKGDTVRVWADVTSVPAGELSFRTMRYCNWNDVKSTPVTLKEGENLLFEKVFDESVQYVFEITDGVAPKNFKNEGTGNAFAGIVVAPEGFKVGFEEPSDLYKYWAKEIKAMRKKKAKVNITNETESDGLRTYHVEISCVGPAPVNAYVSYPLDAEKKSLPIIINLHAAGRPGAASTARSARSYAKIVKGGAIAMDLNAHGMLDDQPKSYYDELSNGLLKGYSSRDPENLDDYYFKWMMLRAERALDYLVKNPLWDGKHIIVTGTSQGGYQSAWLAGIDPRVTTAILTVPAGLDQGSKLQGRPASWPMTYYKYRENTVKNIPYMDPAAFIKNSKADFWCEIGLYDFTCPAANLFAFMNEIQGEKTIVTYQRPHSGYMDKKAHAGVDKQRREYFQKAAVK